VLRQVSTSAAPRSGVGPVRETRIGEERKASGPGAQGPGPPGPVGMMWSVPSLILPVIPDGRVAGSAQPVVPAGGGLVLRPWLLADARAVAAAYADPAIQRWHARRVDSEDEARDLLLRWRRSWLAETGAHWAVTRGEDGEVVGRVALRSMVLDEGWAECAYWTAPAARGSGIASCSLAALSRWAFGEIGFHRIELVHSVANAASCRVAAKAGFAAEGVRRSAVLHADGWHDMHLHARINGDEPRQDETRRE
jgi:[ribosomal protein S5]-alanine N-acetyltransferase